jgi:hypothetical protein
MSNKTIEIKPESREGDSIFDKYFAFFEDIKLRSSKQERVDYSNLINVITILDRNIIDLGHSDFKSTVQASYLNNATTQVLKGWFPVLEYLFRDALFINYLSYNLFGFSLVFNKNDWELDKLNTLIAFFCPSIDYDKLLFDDDFEKGATKGATIYTPTNIFLATTHYTKATRLGKDHEKFDAINYKIKDPFEINAFGLIPIELNGNIDIEQLREKSKKLDINNLVINYKQGLFSRGFTRWEITIKTEDNYPNAASFFNLLYSFSSALELVSDDEIEIKLKDWGNGSKWAKLWIDFKGFMAREEVINVLEKSKKSLEAELFDKRITQVEKSIAETNKLQKETDILPSKEQANEAVVLDNQKKQLEILEKQIDIENKLLEGKLKRIDIASKLSTMIKDGLVQNDSNIQIEINNMLFLSKGENLIESSSLNIIAEKESVQPNLNLSKEDDEDK